MAGVSSTAFRAASDRCLRSWPPSGRQIEVLVDGGIRRGGDVVKALALGAKGVLIGRAYAYGLAAAGEPGVTRAIEILRTDMIRTMKLLGVSSVHDLNRSYIDVPAGWLPGDGGNEIDI